MNDVVVEKCLTSGLPCQNFHNSLWFYPAKLAEDSVFHLKNQLPKSVPPLHMQLNLNLLFILSSSASEHYYFSFPLIPFSRIDIFKPSLKRLFRDTLGKKKEETKVFSLTNTNYEIATDCSPPQLQSSVTPFVTVCVSVVVILLELLISIEKNRKYFPNSTLHYGTTFRDILGWNSRSALATDECCTGCVGEGVEDGVEDKEDEECNNILEEMGFC